MRRKLSLLLFMLFPMLMTSCGGVIEVIPKDDFGVTGVHLNTNEIFLTRGDTYALEAVVSVKDETVDKTLIWRSENSNIASVNNNGVVTGGNYSGSCYVYATSKVGGYFDRCKVSVSGGSSSEITKFSLSETTHTFDTPTESAITIIPTIEPANVSISSISWTITDETVASIEKVSTGLKVTPLAAGSATITGKVGNKTANCIITVLEKPVDPEEPVITLNVETQTININQTFVIVAETINVPKTAALTFTVGDETILEDVSRSERSINVKGLKAGTTTVTATYKTASATCTISVNPTQDDYESFCATFSKPGHVYLHYLRTTDTNYDPWAVWMWQKVPEDSEGTLWGATHATDLEKAGITSVTTSWMTAAQVGKGGNETYSDTNGQIVDIEVKRTDLKGGKTGVDTSFKNADGEYCSRVGFLIVDQTKMTGGSHWTSDGGIEAYIKNFSGFVDDENKYLHIFCIEGQVTSYTTKSGAEIIPNPTATDTTGKYRSQNDIENLLRDDHVGSYSPTSTSFLDDTPGIGYQVFVPAFADSDGDGMGDLGGIIAKLDDNYFKNLGVGVLWLTPVQESGSYHGYDVTDYYKIDPKFGTFEQYKELIKKAHGQGIKVLMDMVINHTSKNNVLFTASQKAGTVEDPLENKYDARNMYLWKFKGDKVREWNGVEVTAPTPATYDNIAVENSSDWYRDGSSNYYYYGKFGSGMAELNYSCEATRLYMERMCSWWLTETGLDGFRLDAVKHIYLESELSPEQAQQYKNDYISTDVSYRTYYDDEKQETVTAKNDYTYDRDLNVKFWKEFAYAVKKDHPNCFLVGENFDGWNERIAPFYEAIDSQFDFSTYYHLNEMGAASIGSDVKTTLEINKAVRSNHINGAFTSNHDISRMMNHAAGALVGNKTHHAEVSSSNLAAVKNQARFAAAVTLLTPGVSWIYYGDELGMTGNLKDKIPGEEDHGNNTDRWYRQSMRWTTELGTQESGGTVYTTNYGFGGLKVKWDSINSNLATAKEQAADNNSMLSYFRLLGKAKKDVRYPTYGYINWSGTVGDCSNSCSMEISDGKKTVHVFINNSGSDIWIPSQDRMGYVIQGSQGSTTEKVGPYGFVVLSNVNA